MKKRLTIGLVGILAAAVIVPKAFAFNKDTSENFNMLNNMPMNSAVTTSVQTDVPDSNANNNQWADQMYQWHNSWIDNAEKDGQINQNQAQTWRAMNAACHGPNGMMRGGSGMGMMGGYQR